MSGIRREACGRGPDEFTGVGEVVGQAADGHDVGGWAAEEDDRDTAGGCGLCDGISITLEHMAHCLEKHSRSM